MRSDTTRQWSHEATYAARWHFALSTEIIALLSFRTRQSNYPKHICDSNQHEHDMIPHKILGNSIDII